jgi:hypothetical protein
MLLGTVNGSVPDTGERTINRRSTDAECCRNSAGCPAAGVDYYGVAEFESPHTPISQRLMRHR